MPVRVGTRMVQLSRPSAIRADGAKESPEHRSRGALLLLHLLLIFSLKVAIVQIHSSFPELAKLSIGLTFCSHQPAVLWSNFAAPCACVNLESLPTSSNSSAAMRDGFHLCNFCLQRLWCCM